MSGATYLGTEKVKKLYIDNTKVKKIFIGTTQVFACDFVFKYSGNCTLNGVACTPDTNYEVEGDFVLKFLTGGNLTITEYGDNPNGFDLFMVGAGYHGSGGDGNAYVGGDCYGGNGGAGGYYRTITSITPDALTEITIGSTGGAHSTFGDYSTSTDSTHKTSVGQGGFVQSSSAVHRGSTAGENGVYAFDDSTVDGILYGACGGGGSCCGQFGETVHCMSQSGGGTTGGGAGGASEYWFIQPYVYAATNGTANTGSGGGGGAFHFMNNGGVWQTTGSVGLGGSGTIILRNHRT